MLTNNNKKSEMGWNLDNSYSRLPEVFFSSTKPSPVSSPKLVIANHNLANSLGLDVEKLQSKDGVNILAGNKIPEGSYPLAQAYAGHQFGHFTMLGDGRAILLGEQITPNGDKVDIQLKGPGKTPYSRIKADGRAAIGPMLREYIISEAMHALRIPTTRSLAVVTTGEILFRNTKQPGAILTRVAASHLRVGTFEYASKKCTVEELKALADYSIQRHFSGYESVDNPYLFLLREVIKRQASLISKWQLVGFVHGVMNTDNMTISGETIDYGPCAFLDVYNTSTVFSSIDTYGRYAYGNQPGIGGWNLARLAESLLPLLHEDNEKAKQIAQEEIEKYNVIYYHNLLSGLRSKLGIFNAEDQDESLIEGLLSLMHKHSADLTNTFRSLTTDKLESSDFFKLEEFAQWYQLYQARLKRQPETTASSKEMMRNTNPAVIPRNHKVEAALEAAEKDGDYSVMMKLLDVLKNPFDDIKEHNEYCTLPVPTDKPYRTYCGT